MKVLAQRNMTCVLSTYNLSAQIKWWLSIINNYFNGDFRKYIHTLVFQYISMFINFVITSIFFYPIQMVCLWIKKSKVHVLLLSNDLTQTSCGEWTCRLHCVHAMNLKLSSFVRWHLTLLYLLFTLNFQEKFLTVFLILVYIFRYLNSLEIKIVRYQYSLLISNLAIVLFGLGKICLTGLEQFWVCEIPSILYVTLISLFLIDFTSFEHRSTTFAKTCPKINDLVLIIWLFSLLLHDNVWPGIYNKFIFQI